MQQDGIYFGPKDKPGTAFCVLFLQANSDSSTAELAGALAQLWQLYEKLKQGLVPDLAGITVPAGELTVLFGYGLNVFKRTDLAFPAPRALRDYGAFRSANTAGGGPLLPGSGLSYAPYISKNKCSEDMVVQFIGNSELAVNRALVETWKFLEDTARETGRAAPVSIAAFFKGFQRDDGRSWIDFHDGVSNLKSEEREGVISIKPSNDPQEAWLDGGTYMAYMRIAVDIAAWRSIIPSKQEEIVGRAKLSGCPLVSASDLGGAVAVAGCPFTGTTQIGDLNNENFRETPVQVDARISQSHVQRANHHQQPLDDPSSARIYRQGFEFLEATEQAPGFRLGLNFVSFQDTPQRLNRILTQPSWLGGTNFGGAENGQNTVPGMSSLLAVIGAGMFLVPPRESDGSFPGAKLFGR